MGRRARARATAAALGAATAVFVLVIGTSAAGAQTIASSAYGVSAEGLVPIEPTPFVESTDGTAQSSALLEVPENPLIGLEAATATAGANAASVELLDVVIGAGIFDELPEPPPELVEVCENLPEQGLPEDLPELPELPLPLPDLNDLPADNLQDLCELLLTPPDSILGLEVVEVQCDGTNGTLKIAGVSLFGQALEIGAPAPNTEIPVEPLLNVTLNKQTANEDGSLTIEGAVIDIGDGAQVITLASATCGVLAEVPAEPDNDVARSAPETPELARTGGDDHATLALGILAATAGGLGLTRWVRRRGAST